MKYHFTASQPDGKIVENEMDAENIKEVLSSISAQGLRPVSIKPVRKAGSLFSQSLFGGDINLTDQVFISKYLALMLKIGTGLLQAINILLEDFTKASVRSFLLEVKNNLEKGSPFYMAFARHPKIFSQVYVNSIKAGEASGNLESIFDHLAGTLSKEKALRDQIRSALFYPIILFSTSVLILIFLVIFALPKIAGVFSESGFDPPLFSKVVFAVGFFFGNYGGIILILLFLVGVAFFVLHRTSFVFKKFVSSIFNNLPLIREVVKKIALQRFAATLASLIKAGMQITDALEITADSIGHMELKEALLRISREGITKGLTVGEAFKREPFFPKTVVNLVSISERAGHIEEVLETLADFYTSEIDSSLKTLVSFLEPILLMGIGLVIGLIALAIVVPIYQLTIQF